VRDGRAADVGALRDPLPPDPVPGLPRRYVHCTVKPGGDSFAGFAAAADSDPAWRLDTLDTGHDAMITAPGALATLLAGVVSAGCQQSRLADTSPPPLPSNP
jgi:hypothetical protein